MDVIGTDERRGLPSWPGSWREPPLRLVAVLAVLVLLGGVASAAVVEQEPAGRAGPDAAAPVPVSSGPAVSLRVVGGQRGLSAGAEAGPAVEAAGEVAVLVTNLRPSRLRLGSLVLEAAGLQVVMLRPVFGQPLAAGESRDYLLTYVVPACAELALPARLRLSYLEADRARTVTVELDAGAVACPEGSTRQPRPDLAVRSLGGSDERVGAGARGTVQLEVRNARERLQLLSVTAEVPGVRFTDRGPPNGITMDADDRVEVRLGFEVDDCALLGRTGRLVLRVRQAGAPAELVLPLSTQERTGVVRQLALDRVLDACR